MQVGPTSDWRPMSFFRRSILDAHSVDSSPPKKDTHFDDVVNTCACVIGVGIAVAESRLPLGAWYTIDAVGAVAGR